MAFNKVCNLTPKDYENNKNYLIAIDKDWSRLSTYLGNGLTIDLPVAKVGGGTRTLNFRNGILIGYVDS
jgi:hypothetical protein